MNSRVLSVGVITHNWNAVSYCFLTALIFIMLYFSPILTCYFLAMFFSIKVPKIVQLYFGVCISVVFSLLVNTRDVYQGLFSGGFGSDIVNYREAFTQIIGVNSFDLTRILQISISQTGSGEPFFWGVVYGLSRIASNADTLWFFLTFFGLLLMLLYSFQNKRFNAIQILVIYCSTITFYVYQGSVIRQGLALIFIYVGLCELSKSKIKKAYVVFFVAGMIHFSALLLLMSVFMGGRIKNFKMSNVKVWGAWLIILVVIGAALVYMMSYLPRNINLFYKIQTRLSGSEVYTSNWEIQFFTEVAIFMLVSRLFKIKFPERIYFSFVFFCCLVVILIPFEGISDRLYRYTYAFYLFFYLYWQSSSSCEKQQKIKLIVQPLVITTFFLWFCFLFSTRYDGFYMNEGLFGVLTARLDQIASGLNFNF